MESGPGALTGFKCWRAAVKSRWEKLPKTFAGCNGLALQRSDTCNEACDVQSENAGPLELVDDAPKMRIAPS